MVQWGQESSGQRGSVAMKRTHPCEGLTLTAFATVWVKWQTPGPGKLFIKCLFAVKKWPSSGDHSLPTEKVGLEISFQKKKL